MIAVEYSTIIEGQQKEQITFALEAGLLILKQIQLKQQVWLSKDFYLLFYDGNHAQISIKTFLSNLSNYCNGYMRHAIILKASSNNPSISEISVHGFNGLHPDIDFYEFESSLLSKTSMNPNIPTIPSNRLIRYLQKAANNIRIYLLQPLLGQQLKSVKIRTFMRSLFDWAVPPSESIHAFLLKEEIQTIGITLRESQKQHLSSFSIQALVNFGVQSIRSLSQLDEALHAGYYFYILTGTTQFLAEDTYIPPVVVLLVANMLPLFLSYFTHHREVATYTKIQGTLAMMGSIRLLFFLLGFIAQYYVISVNKLTVFLLPLTFSGLNQVFKQRTRVEWDSLLL